MFTPAQNYMEEDMLNKAILMGRLVADPELRETTNGISVCSFRIAVDRNYSKEQEKQTDFINIVAWRGTADFVSKYFSKGKMIIVEGAIQTRNYQDKDGNNGTVVEVNASNVMFGESKRQEENPAPAREQDIDTGEMDSEDLPF